MMRNYVVVGALVSFCVGYTSPALSFFQASKICFSTTQKGQDGKLLPLCREVKVDCGIPSADISHY